MTGNAMAIVLRACAHNKFRSVRSLASFCHEEANPDRPIREGKNAWLQNRLRPWERCVNRCQLQNLITDDFHLTITGALALARRPESQPSREAVLRRMDCPLARELLKHSDNGNDDASFTLAFLYWNYTRTTSPEPLTALSPGSSLGGKVVDDGRQISLPLSGDRIAGADRAHTGAPPQPPYIHCTCVACDNVQGNHHVPQCDMATSLPRSHHAK
jgi:hypothetical protein